MERSRRLATSTAPYVASTDPSAVEAAARSGVAVARSQNDKIFTRLPAWLDVSDLRNLGDKPAIWLADLVGV